MLFVNTSAAKFGEVNSAGISRLVAGKVRVVYFYTQFAVAT